MLEDTLTVSGATLTMFAGILIKIDELIGGFDKLDDIATDKNLQMEIIKTVVANYNDNGEVVDYKLNAFNLKPEDFDKILQWSVEHYTVFTTESSTKIIEKLKAMEKKIIDFQKNSQAS